MSCVVDSNVFVSAASPTEAQHADSKRFLDYTRDNAIPILCPAIVVAETAAGIARPLRDSVAAMGTANLIMSDPRVTLVDLTSERARQAAEIASNHFLRGADSIYVQTAQETGGTPVTWDGEMLKRAPAVVPTMTPSDWLTANLS